MTNLYSVTFDRKQIIHKVINQKKGIFESRTELIRQTISGLPYQVAESYRESVGPDVSITLDIPENGTHYSARQKVSVIPMSKIKTMNPVIHTHTKAKPVGSAPTLSIADYSDVVNAMVAAE